MRQIIKRASKDGQDFEFDRRLLMPDGSVKHVHVVAHAERDESGEIEFVGAVMDVSDRKRAEEAMRRSEGYLADAQKLTHTGSWAWNVRTGALFWSQEIFVFITLNLKKGSLGRSSSKGFTTRIDRRSNRERKWKPPKRSGSILRVIFESFFRTER
jgi:PAS domain-containing protein